METKYLQFNSEHLSLAGELIRKGCLVAFPTETVYGLGANALDAQAVNSIYVAKGRPSDNPLIAHVYTKSQIYEIAREVSDDAEKIIQAFMPGSITIVLPKKDIVPDAVTAGLNTVAIRMPKSQQAREFLRYARVPVAAPSANVSGRPSPTSWQRVRDDMDGRIAAILCGEECEVGIESTVLDLSGAKPLILRPGFVTPEQIEQVLGKSVEVVLNPKSKVNSPGVRYRHYAPKVPMALETGGDVAKLTAYYDGLAKQGFSPVLLVEQPQLYGNRACFSIGDSDEQVARSLFENLRILEERYDYIIASFTSRTAFGQSILNRLVRAAGNNLI